MDDKKIEEVAKVYMIGEFYDRDEAEWNYPITNEEKRNQCIIDFKAGAKWAINEFLKNLWHDIFNERIPLGKMVIVEYTYKGGIYYRSLKIPDDTQWVRGFSNEKRLRRWLYVDDLLPKEEHEQY